MTIVPFPQWGKSAILAPMRGELRILSLDLHNIGVSTA